MWSAPILSMQVSIFSSSLISQGSNPSSLFYFYSPLSQSAAGSGPLTIQNVFSASPFFSLLLLSLSILSLGSFQLLGFSGFQLWASPSATGQSTIPYASKLLFSIAASLSLIFLFLLASFCFIYCSLIAFSSFFFSSFQENSLVQLKKRTKQRQRHVTNQGKSRLRASEALFLKSRPIQFFSASGYCFPSWTIWLRLKSWMMAKRRSMIRCLFSSPILSKLMFLPLTKMCVQQWWNIFQRLPIRVQLWLPACGINRTRSWRMVRFCYASSPTLPFFFFSFSISFLIRPTSFSRSSLLLRHGVGTLGAVRAQALIYLLSPPQPAYHHSQKKAYLSSGSPGDYHADTAKCSLFALPRVLIPMPYRSLGAVCGRTDALMGRDIFLVLRMSPKLLVYSSSELRMSSLHFLLFLMIMDWLQPQGPQ